MRQYLIDKSPESFIKKPEDWQRRGSADATELAVEREALGSQHASEQNALRLAETGIAYLLSSP